MGIVLQAYQVQHNFEGTLFFEIGVGTLLQKNMMKIPVFKRKRLATKIVKPIV